MTSQSNYVFVKNDYLEGLSKTKTHLDEVSNYLLNSSKKIRQYCDSFEGELESPAFNLIKKRLMMYSKLFESFANSIKNQAMYIANSNKNVISSMGSFETISSSELDELELQMKKALNNYQLFLGIKEEDTNNKSLYISKRKFAESDYYIKKRKYKEYKDIFEATISSDHKGLSNMNDMKSILNKMDIEIGMQDIF